MTSLPATRLTELLGCRAPLQQAGMAGVTTPALAGAVAGEGAVGMLAATGRAPADAAADVLAARELAGGRGALGVNVLVPFLDPAVVEPVAEAGVALVELFWGDPDPALVARVHAAGALAGWQVGSVEEARMAEGAGCDVVVAQAWEAGGHVRGTTALLPLLDAVLATVAVPVVAAGGIGTGRGVAAALAAGADGVRVGTRFVATEEADVHDAYVAALAAAGPADTVVVEAFARGWPRAPHRVLRSCVGASGADPSTRSPVPPGGAFAGDAALAALYAGQSVGGVRHRQPAAEVVRELLEEAASALGVIAAPATTTDDPAGR